MYSIDKSYKDPLLSGFYVKRCKCGCRPYSDRTATPGGAWWLTCENCDKESEAAATLQEAIENWNTDKLYFGE